MAQDKSSPKETSGGHSVNVGRVDTAGAISAEGKGRFPGPADSESCGVGLGICPRGQTQTLEQSGRI